MKFWIPLLCIFIFYSGFAHAQYVAPQHSKGTCLDYSDPNKPGTADLTRFYIYDAAYHLVYHSELSNQDCATATEDSFYTYLDDAPCYLSAGSDYYIVLELDNELDLRKTAYPGIWVDFDRDSTFGSNEFLIPAGAKGEISTEWERAFHFTVPDSVETGSSRMRIRSSVGYIDSNSANTTLIFGESIDLEVNLFGGKDVSLDFQLRDTGFLYSYIDALNANPNFDYRYFWYLDGVFHDSTASFTFRSFVTGDLEVKLIAIDSNGLKDSVLKSIYIRTPNKESENLFTTSRRKVPLYETFDLIDLSPSSQGSQWKLIKGEDILIGPYSEYIKGGYRNISIYTGLGPGFFTEPGSWEVCLRTANSYQTDTPWTCKKDYIQVEGDSAKPYVELVGSDTIYLTYGDMFISQGAIGRDYCDGDITTQNWVWTDFVQDSIDCFKEIWLTVDNSVNISDSVIRTICVGPDTTSPVLTLAGQDTMYVEVDHAWTDPGATAFDNLDGNLDQEITVTGVVDTSTLGYYNLLYEVYDSFGNYASAIRVVIVGDTTSPQIQAANGDTVLLERGDVFEVIDHVSLSDNYTSDDYLEQNFIVINNDVDTSTIGFYEVQMIVQDSVGNWSDTLTLIVQVREPASILNIRSYISIYPSPTRDFITIEKLGLNERNSFEIVNSLGERVQSGELNQTRTRIDLRALSPGIYFVKLDGVEGVLRIVVL
ncbi:DUF5011 domain-containing protein [bacterium]|nr:DUF5011 domain-containing protein [bacterium]